MSKTLQGLMADSQLDLRSCDLAVQCVQGDISADCDRWAKQLDGLLFHGRHSPGYARRLDRREPAPPCSRPSTRASIQNPNTTQILAENLGSALSMVRQTLTWMCWALGSPRACDAM